jgi:hypothetical protein
MATRKASTQDTPEPSTEVATRRALDDIVPEQLPQASLYSEDELRGLSDWDQAMRLAMSVTGEAPIMASEEMGDGFQLIDSERGKATLIDVPFVLLEWTFRDGDFGTYVSCRGMTKEGRKFILNDGSTGIAEQLAKLTKDNNGRMSNLVVGKGLRVSEYPTDVNGQPLDKKTAKEFPDQVKGTGRTFYLNTSA